MKQFLKENWFKVGVLVVLLVIGLSAVFMIKPISWSRDGSSSSVQNDLNLQVKCADWASRFFTSRVGDGSGSSYQNHFNVKLQKCFILITTYLPKEDFVGIEMLDAVSGKRFATYNGQEMCNVAVTKSRSRCELNGGMIWFDGNEERRPADVEVGFRGLKYGGGKGDENTKNEFLNHIHRLMSE